MGRNGPEVTTAAEGKSTSPEELNMSARQTLLDVLAARGSQVFDLDGAKANVGLAKDGQVYLHVYGEKESTTVTIRPNGELYASSSTHEQEAVYDSQSELYSYRSKPSMIMPVPDELARSYVERAGQATLQNN